MLGKQDWLAEQGPLCVYYLRFLWTTPARLPVHWTLAGPTTQFKFHRMGVVGARSDAVFVICIFNRAAQGLVWY